MNCRMHSFKYNIDQTSIHGNLFTDVNSGILQLSSDVRIVVFPLDSIFFNKEFDVDSILIFSPPICGVEYINSCTLGVIRLAGV